MESPRDETVAGADMPAEGTADDVAPEEIRRAVDLAYRALAVRDRTEAELRAFLERKRVHPGAIEAAVADVSEAGYLDDIRYAHRFAEDKRSIERWGSDRIERDLLRRGIAGDLAAAAAAADDPADERAAALALLAERFPRGVPDDRQRDRAWRLLVRRGYQPELAYEAVRAHERAAADAAAGDRAA